MTRGHTLLAHLSERRRTGIELGQKHIKIDGKRQVSSLTEPK